ncbi:hypothetical protein ACWEPN_03840 [Nonomuraea wenchangensis]
MRVLANKPTPDTDAALMDRAGDHGLPEWALRGPAAWLRERLGAAGTYAEFKGGHDRYCRRDEPAEGLIAIYG